MIELLSEFEANGSALLMKHRDHYSHSVYVFCLGLAIYKSNEIFRKTYKEYYKISDEKDASAHYLKFWGLSSLFHDIGYPFELPFEQVSSYFEVEGGKVYSEPGMYVNVWDGDVASMHPHSAIFECQFGETGFWECSSTGCRSGHPAHQWCRTRRCPPALAPQWAA